MVAREFVGEHSGYVQLSVSDSSGSMAASVLNGVPSEVAKEYVGEHIGCVKLSVF